MWSREGLTASVLVLIVLRLNGAASFPDEALILAVSFCLCCTLNNYAAIAAILLFLLPVVVVYTAPNVDFFGSLRDSNAVSNLVFGEVDAISMLFLAKLLLLQRPAWWFVFEASVIIHVLTWTEFHSHSVHLTWWALTFMASYNYLRAWDVATGRTDHVRFTPALLVVSGTVFLGTISMSIYRCDLLEVSHKNMGTLPYIFGNFAVHGYPFIRAVYDITPYSFGISAPGILYVWIYASTHNESDLYGCTLEPTYADIAIETGSAAVAIASYFSTKYVFREYAASRTHLTHP